jgi:signal transduction histidine kinase
MIRDLLDASRLKAGEGIPISVVECRVDQVVDSVAKDLAAIYGPKFRVRNEHGAIVGNWDCTGIQRIIENLASNAVKYGKEKAPVTISLEKSEEFVEIAVHNEGDAIPADEQTTLFSPYRRSPSAVSGGQGGWGIGLTLVKGLTEAHGGVARVESSVTAGTTFYVRLPFGLKANV